MITAMTKRQRRRVVSVDILNGDVIVTFDDGKCAVYPAAVLYTLLPQVGEGSGSDTTLRMP